MNIYSVNLLPKEVSLVTARQHKLLRKKNGYSQKELAERAGISLGSLKRFEQSGQISLESFLKLLHVLDRLTNFSNVLKIDDSNEKLEQLFSDKTR